MELVIVIIASLIQGLIFGLISRAIAKSKGYDTGFAWGFWLGLIGVIVVACKTDISQQYNAPYQPMYPSAAGYQMGKSVNAGHSSKGWTCTCGATNPSSIDTCLSCRRYRHDVESKKTCPHCGANNKQSNIYCFACGKAIDEAAQPQAAAPAPAPAPAIEAPAPKMDASDAFTLLEKLGKLHETGILTDEEFQKKKTEILDKM